MLEKGTVTSGSTWHAAGLVGQLRNNSNLTKLGQYSTKLYREIGNEIGRPVDWKEVGSIRLASSDSRWTELKKSYGVARGFGFEMELISPAEAKRYSSPIS